jgi:cyclic pyranopterin phosphate synthase
MMGIEKIRITGGEPFVRKDIMQLLSALSKLDKLNELTLTTNGLLTAPLIPEFKKLGINSVNLSLDTLDKDRFFAITRRDEVHKVLDTLDKLLIFGIVVKINAVVMNGVNTQDIIPLTELTKNLPVSVRFIEEMPFNGVGHSFSGIAWNHTKILATIKEKFPGIKKTGDPLFSTSDNYQIPGHLGTVGTIAAYSRTFCGTCNRLRITPEGIVKTCLYDNGILNIKEVIRKGSSDNDLTKILLSAIGNRSKNGWDAAQARSTNSLHGSMATIGG